MTTLVLNVDRDNDFGIKAGIRGPVVGYSQCYNAAVKLITVDPEDSDANALFGALKHYEHLQSKGEDVDIALITGDDDVGEKSDEILAAQIEQVVGVGKYNDVVLISDGAEDDYIIPLILSRVKIRYVKHIIVRHNQNIESMYYYIVKAMQDKKLVKKFYIPIGLILLTYGITALSFAIFFDFIGKSAVSPSFYALTLVTVVIGGYFTERGFDIKDHLIELIKDIQTYSEEARLMFISSIVSIGIILVGISSTYSIFFYTSVQPIDRILYFFQIFSLWAYSSVLSRALFKIADIYVGGSKSIPSLYYAISFSVSAEILLFGIIGYIRYALNFTNFRYSIFSIVLIVIGVSIALATAGIHKRKNVMTSLTAIGKDGQ
ncbi:MAG: DUF373 family protein [Candidatus Thermoplasmatota archaeon]|nr:DUF373 family protein [Candidatus Thermoplasmatota archaeon]MCL5790445.1 DUF373 family protein [Candidatus Thermoplasmatota archaeon]